METGTILCSDLSFPVDTLKTTMQTQGSNGLTILKDRVKAYGIGTLWVSSLGATSETTF